MLKATVVVSSLVDDTIKEAQRDTTFYLFKNLEELDKYTNQTPIRADTLFFTKDVLPLSNTSLNYLIGILERAFIKVDNVIYITVAGSSEIQSVKYIVQSKEYTNWEIVQGALTREYVRGIITGALRNDFTNVKRKAVYRVPRSTYIADNAKISSLLEQERFKDDDEQMQEMPEEQMPVYVAPSGEQTCVCYDIVGDNREERTLFCFITAQYLATIGKTLIVERDVDYHRLGDYVTKSDVEAEIILLEDLYNNVGDVLTTIRNTKKKLIAVICKRRLDFSYPFVFNLLYSNLSSTLQFAVREDDFGEEPTESPYTVVFPNTVAGVLSLCDKVNTDFLAHTKFVAVHMHTLLAVRLPVGEVMRTIIRDVLNSQDIPEVEIVSITSLRLGVESTYDIRSMLHEVRSV